MPNDGHPQEDAGPRTFLGSEYNKDNHFLSTAQPLERTL
ncbi:Uncharacterised protein [Ectopseudomonas mendocina]|jgi:hypothetical protein|uniref:Uncharacterized protein n=1 Tax=Ectopseudomonas mendocina TaxID=300 RepID=A0A379IZH8_ECTME|nr:Uncharacterised protein [Pseudomonas mendocina]SUD41697.1 Uncharacterised protein [Pseudomonas mendocina]